jgi:ABC-type transport system substrate-binding protein
MKVISRISVTAVAVAVGVSLAGCGDDSGSDGSGGPTTLRLSMQAPPSDLSIGNFSGGDATIFMSVYDTIVHRAQDGELGPGIAESWEYSDDRKTLTLDIRDGMTFSNGEPLDAQAVAASLEAARKGTSTAQNLAALSQVQAPDPATVVITLSQPDAALVPSLSGSGGAVGAPGALTAEDSKLWPVGSGPYLLDRNETTVGATYVLKRNPDYWDEERFPFDEVRFQVIADQAAAQNAALSGQLDYVGLPSKDVVAQFDNGQFTTGINKPNAVAVLWLVDRAGQVVPQLGDVRVRRAINLAIDRDSIAERLNPGTNHATNQIFSPDGDAFDQDLLSEDSYDLDQAKQLMAEAGQAGGFTVTMPSTNLTTPYESVITQALRDIGITVNWETVPFQDFYSRIFSGRYGMFFMFNGLSGSDTQDLKASMSGVFNPFRSTTPELAQLLATMNAAPEEEQGPALRAINAHLVEQAWFAPVSDVTGFYAVSKNIAYTPSVVVGQGVQSYQPAATK